MPFKFNVFTGNFDQTGSGGGATVFDGEVQFFSDLPQTVGTPPVNSAYLVRESEGTIWFGNKKQNGIYIRSGNSGVRNDDWTYGGEYPVTSVNGATGAVTLTASSVSALPAPTISSPSISGDTILAASRNQLRYLTATGGTTANITLPYSGNQNGDICTLVAVFVGASSIGQFTIRAAGQMAGGSPLGYSTIATLLSSGQSVSLVSDGSNGFGGWTIVSFGTHKHSISDVENLQSSLDAKQASGSYPTTDNAVQEYNVTGVLLPNGDSGSGVQLTRNTATPQAPDGSDRTFNAEQLIYTRVNGNSLRMDTFLKDKSQWFWTSVPSTKTSTGTTSQVAYDSNYLYICVATNKWVRIALATNW